MKSHLDQLREQYQCLGPVDLDPWLTLPNWQRWDWLQATMAQVKQPEYTPGQRVIFTYTVGDVYENPQARAGLFVQDFQRALNAVDISNYFVVLITNDADHMPAACAWVQAHVSRDPVPFTHIAAGAEHPEKRLADHWGSQHSYNNTAPLKISADQLTEQQQQLLTQSQSFCMYPWTHIHAYPTGEAHLCCQTDMRHSIGSLREHTLHDLWNSAGMRDARSKMLNNEPVSACQRCYEQEAAGFFSGRQSANKHHGHHIGRVAATKPDGHLDQFELTYWDIRFSNLCNLSCRSCGHIFSSSWYQDQRAIAGADWAARNPVLNYAGRFETDAWDQLVEHMPYVEQIYFAGGEPLMMAEHYRILEELERQGRFDVRLVYNTNFTHVRLKDRWVFDYWKKFDSVSVGASLDAAGPRGEYIRNGTVWDTVERNRAHMLEICPRVDFYISPTLSIMNAWHLPAFHRDWTQRGFIRAQDLNINILQDPPCYRIDAAPIKYKQRLRVLWEEHLEWLRPQDSLGRATQGWQSAQEFMMATDNTAWLPEFWRRTQQLDQLRRQSWQDSLPELEALL